MVRWAVIIGVLCVAASIPLFVAAARAAGRNDAKTEVGAKKAAKICDEQNASAPGNFDACPIGSSGGNESARNAIGGAVLLALGLSQFVAAGRLGVTVTSTGVIVRNPLRTHRLRWSEVERFRIGTSGGGNFSYAFGWVDLIDGSSRRLEAICVLPWESKVDIERHDIIATLNRDHAAAVDTAPAADG